MSQAPGARCLPAALVFTLLSAHAMAQPAPGAPPAVGVVRAEPQQIIQSDEFIARVRAVNRVAIVELIGATTTKTGLKVECVLDTRTYEKGINITKAEMATLAITGDAFHPEWNYTIKPRRPTKT